MKILFDHNVDRRFRKHLTGHDVRTTREMHWEELKNGELLARASASGFDAFLSIDKNLEHQQNLSTLPLPIAILDSRSNALPSLLQFAPFLIHLLSNPLEKCLHIIQADVEVVKLTAPRG